MIRFYSPFYSEVILKYDNDESKKDNDSLGCVPSLDE